MSTEALLESVDSGVLWFALIFFALLGLLYFGLRKQNATLNSGRLLADQQAQKKSEELVAEAPFDLAQADKWCRISLQFHARFASKSDFKRRQKTLTRHDFRLQLFDHGGRCLIDEARSLDEIGYINTRASRSRLSLFVVERSRGSQTSDNCPVVECLLPATGKYLARFSIRATASAVASGVEQHSEIDTLSLIVREAVAPLTHRAYPHRRVNLRDSARHRVPSI